MTDIPLIIVTITITIAFAYLSFGTTMTHNNADAPPRTPRFAPKNSKRPFRAHDSRSLRLVLRLSGALSGSSRLTGVVKPRSLRLVLSNQPNFWDLKIGPAYG